MLRLFLLSVGLALLAAPGAAGAQLTAHNITAWAPAPVSAVYRYGPGQSQVAELRLPPGERAGRLPVVVVIHGGCWLAEYDRVHVGRLSTGLARAGFAVWTLEYRRLGEPGGGWPDTFNDVAAGIEALRTVADQNRLDLARVVLLGHSSGGQLALWYAEVGRLGAESELRRSQPLSVRGVVALAAMTDLAAPDTACGDLGLKLVGGRAFFAQRAPQVSPLAMLPLGVPVRLLHGLRDGIVPIALSRTYARAAAAAGDDVKLTELPGAGHFELIDPEGPAWPAVLGAVSALAGSP